MCNDSIDKTANFLTGQAKVKPQGDAATADVKARYKRKWQNNMCLALVSGCHTRMALLQCHCICISERWVQTTLFRKANLRVIKRRMVSTKLSIMSSLGSVQDPSLPVDLNRSTEMQATPRAATT